MVAVAVTLPVSATVYLKTISKSPFGVTLITIVAMLAGMEILKRLDMPKPFRSILSMLFLGVLFLEAIIIIRVYAGS